MTFCDKEVVSTILAGKKIALVGSGPSVMENEPGFIDSHDVVVRISNYKLYEPTGYRTDVFYSFFGHSIKKTKEDLIKDGVFLCMNKCPDSQPIESAWHIRRNKLHGIDYRYIYKSRRKWWFCDTYAPTTEEFLRNFDLLGQHIPTTGFSALLDILSYGPESVYMTGFDFFESKVHNVNEPWRKMNNEDPIGHDPAAEKRWFIAHHQNHPIILDKRLQQVANDI